MKAVAKNLIARYPEQDLQRAEVLEACSRQYCARSASDGNDRKQHRKKGGVS